MEKFSSDANMAHRTLVREQQPALDVQRKLDKICDDISKQKPFSAGEVKKALGDVPPDDREQWCLKVLESSAFAKRKDLIRTIVKSFDCDFESVSRVLLSAILSSRKSPPKLKMLNFIVNEMGAKVDVSWDGDTPLLVAIVKNDFDLLSLFVEAFKADVNFHDGSGCLPLQASMEQDLK